jgi:hypothetical protein
MPDCSRETLLTSDKSTAFAESISEGNAIGLSKLGKTPRNPCTKSRVFQTALSQRVPLNIFEGVSVSKLSISLKLTRSPADKSFDFITAIFLHPQKTEFRDRN